jgi:hypothetical protein
MCRADSAVDIGGAFPGECEYRAVHGADSQVYHAINTVNGTVSVWNLT